MKSENNMLSTLYANYLNDLLAYGNTLGIPQPDLEDTIHDVFLHLMEHCKCLNLENESIKYYLMRSVKNKIISNHRKQKEFCAIDDASEYNFPIRTTGLDLLIYKEEQHSIALRIESMLQHLTGRQKEALQLRYMQEMDYEEIARQLCITEKGSRKLVSRAISELRKCAV